MGGGGLVTPQTRAVTTFAAGLLMGVVLVVMLRETDRISFHLQKPAPQQSSLLLPPAASAPAQASPAQGLRLAAANHASADPNNSPIGSFMSSKFYDTAVSLHNGKVTPPGGNGIFSHHYETTMTKYLGHLPEDTPLRILEIGLGCGTPQEWGGVGNSLQLWKRLFPHAAVSFIEVDAPCADKFRADIEATGGRLYTGPQAEPATIAPVLADAAAIGPFDLIVDDGGHHPEHQRLSLELLWPTLRPFGLYVIEDLLTTYFVAYETIGAAPSAIVPFLTEAMSALHCRTAATVGEIHNPWKAYCQRNSTIPQLVKREFLSIDCASEICAIMKHQTPLPPATVL